MNYRHGKKKTKIYGIWCSMISRCHNPNSKSYPNYGGRGITVCDRWRRFERFYEDMGDRPAGKTLERTNNDRGYSPENCVWAGRVEQSRNRRGLRKLVVDGAEKTMSEWAEYSGLCIATLWQRINKGWTPEEAVKIPLITKRKGIKRGEKLRYYAESSNAP